MFSTGTAVADQIRSDNGQQTLERLYGSDAATIQSQTSRYLDLVTSFAGAHGYTPDPALQGCVISSPTRLEVLGNHTDHQNGKVIGASLTTDTIGFAVPNHTNEVRIVSREYPGQVFRADLTDLGMKEDDLQTAKLLKGVCRHLLLAGRKVCGFDAVMSSDAKLGSGVSTSASCSMLIGGMINSIRAIKQVADQPLSILELAKAGRFAENEYWKKGSGLLDQLTSAIGGAAFIDFGAAKTPAIQKIDVDLSRTAHAMLLIDTHTHHSDGSDEYSKIPGEMRSVAAVMGGSVLADVARADFISKLVTEPQLFTDDRAALRALHYYNENTRVEAAAHALSEGNNLDFIRCVNASGLSSQVLLQNTHDVDSRSQGIELAIALVHDITRKTFSPYDPPGYAVRVHGGGFGGTVLAILPVDAAAAVERELNPFYQEKFRLKAGHRSVQPVQIRNDGLCDVTEMIASLAI